MLFKNKKSKIFCIGLNKTGTTTIEKVLMDFKYKLGNQEKGELLFKDWYKRDFSSIIKLSKTAEAFQDAPFSFPFTFIALDQYFCNAKFILTVRDSPEQWYNSLVTHHSKVWADGINPPTSQDLKNAEYRYKGFAYENNKVIFKTPEDDPYNKEILLDYYTNHNYQVIEYFRSCPEKLLVINVSNDTDYIRLCDFLNKKPIHKTFPWENKTSEKKKKND
tara:strand:+ start:828 stop:1484 length:657 start_codon:yes stop_codon:yes gene_type:complete